jgi:LPS export ABC transporter protein LptC
MRVFVVFGLMLGWVMNACTPPENTKPVLYEGPLRVVEEVDMIHTEKEVIKNRLKAKKIIEYANGDREFPEGVYLEFYNPLGVLTSTLSANDAFFFKAENKWRGRGNVEVKNLENEQQLNTEELFWEPATKKIYTDKFVTIRDAGDILYGTGMDARQDLSNYHIKKPEAEFQVNE